LAVALVQPKHTHMHATVVPVPQYNDICWKGAADSFDKLEPSFPVAELVFGGNARLRLTPLRYLFMMRPGEYCLGFFDNGASGTLIGGVSVRNVLVQVGLIT
jgi:Xylanase inhibitor C-terminal